MIKCDLCNEEYFGEKCRKPDCMRIRFFSNKKNLPKVQRELKIPEMYRGASIDDFSGYDEYYTDESIILMGDTGTGKTHFAVTALTEWAFRHEDFDNCKMISVPKLLLEIRNSFSSKYTDMNEAAVVDYYSNLPCLVLDDFGSEKVTEFSLATLYLIISNRYDGIKTTIVTTNLTLAEIDNFDHRIASRFASFKLITLESKDRRIKA